MNRNKDVRTALFLRGVWISARPVIWYGFFIAVILKYVVFGKYEVRITHFLVYVAAAFIILVPVFSGWITHALRMRPFCGRVEEIKKKQILVTDSTVRRKGGDLYHTPKVIIYVRGTNDRIRRFPINNPSFVDIDYIKKGDYVIVETERGMQFGQAVTNIEQMPKEKVFLPLKDVIRKANKDDINANDKNERDGAKALSYAKELVNKQGLDMKLFEASYTFDRKKLIFKFIADERVDFRELAKLLAAKYKTRIELRQIGVRDKAKEIGGLGPCGRPLCCSLFLTNFNSVSINMAKNQGIALNPTKINGACGRLLCCLGYEDETYTEYKKHFPKLGESVEVDGKKGRVCELNVLSGNYKVKVSDNEEIIVSVDINGNN